MKTLLVMYIALVFLALAACKPQTQSRQATVPPISGDCIANQANCQSNLYNTPGYAPYNYNNNYVNNYGNPYGSGNYGGGYYGGGYYGGGYSSGYQHGGGSSNGPFHYLNNSAYLCNCQPGFIPTYNTHAGLGCVQSQIAAGTGYGSSYGNGYGTSYTASYGTGYNGSYSGGAYAYFSWGANNNQWTNIPQISNHTGYTNSGCYNGVVQSCLVDQPSTCSTGYTCRAETASSRLGLCKSNSAAGNGSYGPVVR